MKNLKLILGTLALIVATGTLSYSMEVDTNIDNENLITNPSNNPPGSHQGSASDCR